MMAARPSAAASAAPRAPSVSGGAAHAAAPRRSAAVCAGSGNNRKLRDLEKRLERGRQRLEQIEMAREVEEGGGELPPRPAEDAAERLELAAEAMELPAWEGPDEGFEDCACNARVCLWVLVCVCVLCKAVRAMRVCAWVLVGACVVCKAARVHERARYRAMPCASRVLTRARARACAHITKGSASGRGGPRW